MLNISGTRSAPALVALAGVAFIILGLVAGEPPLTIIGVVFLVLAVLQFLTRSR